MCDGISAEDFVEAVRTLVSIINYCIEDKNVQVYQSTLILLDEMLVQCEGKKLSKVEVTLLLSKTITDVISKLTDSSHKVVDATELSLLAMAHSSCVDVTHIVNAVTKKIRTVDLKGGRTIKARLQFIERLIAEFSDEIQHKRVLDFAKGQYIESFCFNVCSMSHNACF